MEMELGPVKPSGSVPSEETDEYSEWLDCINLTPFQQAIANEAEEKIDARGGLGLSLPMGTGKTILSLYLALRELQLRTDDHPEPILCICSKTLLSTWTAELQKFFGSTFPYEVLHQEWTDLTTWTPKQGTLLVLTTPAVARKSYIDSRIGEKYTRIEFINPRFPILSVRHYTDPDQPFGNVGYGYGLVHSRKWSNLIVDEADAYTNIECAQNMAIASISARKRWLMSGTLFHEPVPRRVLGYLLMLNDKRYEKTLPNIERLMYDYNPRASPFRGLAETTVRRTKNEDAAHVHERVESFIVTHGRTHDETLVHVAMRNVIRELHGKAHDLLLTDEERKKYSAYVMAMLTYLRQALICPVLPIATIALKIANAETDLGKQELNLTFQNAINQLHLTPALDSLDFVFSSRLRAVMDKIIENADRRIAVFTCFRRALLLLQHYLHESGFRVFCVTGNMTSARRSKELQDFLTAPEGILLLTYDVGANGLNLQAASCVMLMDFWWNAGKTQQAVARVVRRGQQQDVRVYYFTSDTGLERIILEKQKSKLRDMEQLLLGKVHRSERPSLSQDELVRSILCETNAGLVREVYQTNSV